MRSCTLERTLSGGSDNVLSSSYTHSPPRSSNFIHRGMSRRHPMLYASIPNHRYECLSRSACHTRHLRRTNFSKAYRERYRKPAHDQEANHWWAFSCTPGDPVPLRPPVRTRIAHLSDVQSRQDRFVPLVPSSPTMGSFARPDHTLRRATELPRDPTERLWEPTSFCDEVLAAKKDDQRRRHKVRGWCCGFWRGLGIDRNMSRSGSTSSSCSAILGRMLDGRLLAWWESSVVSGHCASDARQAYNFDFLSY